MKRIHYIVLAVILTVCTGCSELMIDPTPQTPDMSRSYIFFNPVVNEVADTKAPLLTGDKLPSETGTDFGVLGYYDNTSLFNTSSNGIARVYRPDNNKPFQYDNLICWVHPSAEHHFYAFYPYQINGVVPTITSGNAISYTQPSTNDATMVDLMTAYTSTGKCSEVDLEFHHRLWALDVVIRNSQTQGLDGTTAGDIITNPSLFVKSVKVHVDDFPTGGTIPLDGSISTPNTATADYSYTVFTSADGEEIKSASATTDQTLYSKRYGSLLFVRGAALKYRLEITYVDSRGADKGTNTFYFPSQTAYQTSTVNFAEGMRYTLTVEKKNDTFVVGALRPSNWTVLDEIEHEFN